MGLKIIAEIKQGDFKLYRVERLDGKSLSIEGVYRGTPTKNYSRGLMLLSKVSETEPKVALVGYKNLEAYTSNKGKVLALGN